MHDMALHSLYPASSDYHKSVCNNTTRFGSSSRCNAFGTAKAEWPCLDRPPGWLTQNAWWSQGQFQQVELFHRSMNLLDAAVLDLYYVNSSQENCPLLRLWTDFRGKKKKKSSNYLRQEIIAVFCFYLWEENTKSPKTLRTKKNISDDYNHPVRSVVSCFKMFSLCSMKIRWQVCSINRMLWQKTWRLLFERETVLTFRITVY